MADLSHPPVEVTEVPSRHSPGFLNEEAHQLGCIIEAGKDAGLVNPEIDTTAFALLCQAVGIGTHLVLSAGLDESHVPAAEKWDDLLAAAIGCLTTTEPRSSPPPAV